MAQWLKLNLTPKGGHTTAWSDGICFFLRGYFSTYNPYYVIPLYVRILSSRPKNPKRPISTPTARRRASQSLLVGLLPPPPPKNHLSVNGEGSGPFGGCTRL